MQHSPDRITIENISALAKLRLSPGEAEALGNDFDQMLSFIQILDQIKTSGLPETSRVFESGAALRPDVPEPPFRRDELLSCAPFADGQGVSVPETF